MESSLALEIESPITGREDTEVAFARGASDKLMELLFL